MSPWASALRTARWVASGAIVAIVAVLAARADAQSPHATGWSIALDLAVGVSFVAAALGAPTVGLQRLLIGGVGVTWLLGSVLPALQSLHQWVLAVALLTLPTGRLRGRVPSLLVWLGVPVAAGLLQQVVVALLFFAVAVVSRPARRPRSTAGWFGCVVAVVMGCVLAGSWVLARRFPEQFEPQVAFVAYELVLLVVGVITPFAMRAAAAERRALTDRLFADERLSGLDGITAVLRRTLGDPDLWISTGDPGPATASRLVVRDRGKPIAAVHVSTSVLDHPATAGAVAEAVRLSVIHLRLVEEQHRRLGELEAARARMVAAADAQRERAALALREGVDAPLRAAWAELRTVRAGVHADQTGAALAIALDEIAAATREIVDLVTGVPPADMGGGRLRPALLSLAATSPVPVSVTMAPEAAADAEAETALYYVCSEALANANKHAHARRVTVVVSRVDTGLVTIVSDDGVGGADPDGSGLLGLADRLAIRGGRLQVDSRPGTGTTVSAFLPTGGPGPHSANPLESADCG